MAGLGSVTENSTVFLSIVGKHIWNKKAKEDNPDFFIEKYTKKGDDTEYERKGARYRDLTGSITSVKFNVHADYGKNLNVGFQINDDHYTISVGTKNRAFGGFMKMLLVADLSEELFVKPYDFVDKKQKRAVGCSFRQGGEKLVLKVEGAPRKSAEWFNDASDKDKKRFFEDVTDWYIDKVESEICSQFAQSKPGKAKAKVEEIEEEQQPEQEPTKTEKSVESKSSDVIKVTPMKMRKALRAYITENYPENELPKTVKGEELEKWYALSLEDGELPFPEARSGDSSEDLGDEDESSVDDQLKGLLNG